MMPARVCGVSSLESWHGVELEFNHPARTPRSENIPMLLFLSFRFRQDLLSTRSSQSRVWTLLDPPSNPADLAWLSRHPSQTGKRKKEKIKAQAQATRLCQELLDS